MLWQETIVNTIAQLEAKIEFEDSENLGIDSGIFSICYHLIYLFRI